MSDSSHQDQLCFRNPSKKRGKEEARKRLRIPVSNLVTFRRKSKRQSEIEIEGKRQRETQRDTERQQETERDGERQRETERDKKRHRETDRE